MSLIKTTKAREVEACLQREFYGVYHMLRFRLRKVYGCSLEDLLSMKPLEVVGILEGVVENRETLDLIIRECFSEIKEVREAILA